MKPFDIDFILEKVNEYNGKISTNEVGNYKIVKSDFNDSEEGYLYNKKLNIEIKVPELLVGDESIMKINPKEIQGAYESIKYAKGKVGIVGLGLGYTAQEIAKKEDVTEVIVYEISKEVVELYYNNFDKDNKIKIIIGDAYKAQKESFDFFYVDTYGYELSNKVIEDYKKYNKIHDIEEYTFWGLEHFLLSCRYEEIVWVYIPELWMEMSKKLFTALSDSQLLSSYSQLDPELVSNILSQFKDIFDEE